MIRCKFLNDDASCRQINEKVGALVVIDVSVCEFCVKIAPEEEGRIDSYPVLNIAYGELKRQGRAVGPAPVYQPDLTSPAWRRTRTIATARRAPEPAPAPIIPDPQTRLDICQQCPHWDERTTGSGMVARCKAVCSGCAAESMPRPLESSGRDCPLRKWRRG